MTTPREYALTPPAHLVPGLLDGTVTQVRVPVKCPKWLREMQPDFDGAWAVMHYGVTPGLKVPVALLGGEPEEGIIERLRNPWGWADHNAPILKGHGEPTPVRFWLRETWSVAEIGWEVGPEDDRPTPFADIVYVADRTLAESVPCTAAFYRDEEIASLRGPKYFRRVRSSVTMPKWASRASFDLVGVWAKRDESGASPVGWDWLLTLQRVENA